MTIDDMTRAAAPSRGAPARRGMVWIAGGTFHEGTDDQTRTQATPSASVERLIVELKPKGIGRLK